MTLAEGMSNDICRRIHILDTARFAKTLNNLIKEKTKDDPLYDKTYSSVKELDPNLRALKAVVTDPQTSLHHFLIVLIISKLVKYNKLGKVFGPITFPHINGTPL